MSSHAHAHAHPDQAPHAILRAIGITVVFMIVELVGGWYANSLALVSDAAHMLTDVGALLLSLFAIWMARRPVTLTMSFGYHRAEILGALASGLMIWFISGLLIYQAILRMSAPPEVHGPVVFVVALMGLIANLASMKILHSSKEESINVRAAYLHLLTDSLGSVSAVIAGLVLSFTTWRLIDPIVTVLFSILMLASSWSLVTEAVGVLMESAPTHLDPTQVQKDLNALTGVEESHDLHIWSVSTGKLALSVHLIATATPQTVLAEANRVLEEKYGIHHTTIQIEHPEHFRSERCYDCAPKQCELK